MKKISRRSFLTVTGVLAASAAMTACSGGGSTKPAAASSAAASTAPASSAAAGPDPTKYEVGDKVTLLWWHSLDSQYDELVQGVCSDFNKSQDKVTIEPQYIGSYSDINEALVAANAAGSGLPGVVVANTDYVASYGANGLYECLDDYIYNTSYDADDFSAGLLLSSQCDGKQVALPFLHSTQVLFYNKKIADEHGYEIPEKMTDFTAFMEKVHSETGLYGTIIPGWDQWYFETIYLNEGVQIVTDENTCDLDSDTAVEIVKMFRDWCDKGLIYWAKGTDASATMRKHFYDSETFSVMHTSSMYNSYVQKCDFEVGMAWYPAGSVSNISEVGGCVIGIPAKNPQNDKNGAWQFLSYLVGKDCNMRMARGTGYIPTRNSVLQTQEGIDFLAEKPAYKCIFDNLNLINPRIQHPAWSELATTWKNYMDTILNQNGDLETNLVDMTAEITELLND